MDKRRPRLDSMHQKGPETPLVAPLTVVAMGITGGGKSVGRIFDLRDLGMFLATLPQPVELWTNRCHGWIQQV